MKIFKIIILLFFILNIDFYNTCKGNELIHKKTIAIDLDGVLDNYTKYTDAIPPMRDGAEDFIIKLSKNYNLILFTTRSSKLATKWLIDNKIDKYFIDVTNTKPLACLYIDDRAINFNGNYGKTLEEIEKFEVYWKK